MNDNPGPIFKAWASIVMLAAILMLWTVVSYAEQVANGCEDEGVFLQRSAINGQKPIMVFRSYRGERFIVLSKVKTGEWTIIRTLHGEINTCVLASGVVSWVKIGEPI